jgi:DNA polymerase
VHITIDFETYSEADLKKTGAYKYSEHPSTEVLCLAYAFNNEEPHLWHPGIEGEEFGPQYLFMALNAGAPIIDAHNVGFERAIWENVCVKRMGWPEIEAHQYDCTMARAASRALPLGLEQCAAALGLDVRKDKRGKQLIHLLCRPQKPKKKDPRTRIQDPELLAELYDYCKQDVRVEQRIRRELGALPAPERGVFLLNEKMNARGITIDVESVHNAIAIVKEVEKELTAELVEITGGRIETANQVAEILDFVQWKVDGGLDDLTADTVAAAIPRAEQGSVERRVLEIRASLAKASTKKLAGLLSAVCADGRVRGLSQYHGAFTGRNAGRLVQPLNLPRPKLDADPESLIEAIATRDPDWLRMMYGDPMQCVADALRPMFMAGEGKNLCSVDLASIESVGIAAIAGEESKLDLFRRGDDPYCAFASAALGRAITKATDPVARQEVGKVGELAFGFGGGVGAWRNFDDSDRFCDTEVNGFKNAWRRKHPNIARPPWDQEVKDGEAGVGLWYGLQDAAHEAVLKPGKQCEAFGVKYQVRGRWLVCTLPSSRNIAYYDPLLKEKVNPHTDRSEVVLTYMSQKSGHWQRIDTWGGKLAQGVTQATCRDILVHGQRRCDPEMPVLMTVYDEIVTEVDEDLGTEIPVTRLMEYMTGELPAWCATWPVKAEGWCGKRYRK